MSDDDLMCGECGLLRDPQDGFAPQHRTRARCVELLRTQLATARAELAEARKVVRAAKTIEEHLPPGYLLLRDAIAAYDAATKEKP